MRNAARVALLVAFTLVAACGGGDGNGPSDPVPTSLAVNGGNSQSAPVATALPVAPSVIVKDQRGNGIPGIIVTFAVQSGGGTISGAQAVTSQGGIAQVGSWILGTATGANTLSATVQGLTPITLTATATAGAPAALVFIAAPASTAANGATLAPAPSVQVKDQFGNNSTQAGFTVTASLATGGGTLGGTLTVAANASGVATFTNLAITGTVGPRTLSFSGTGVPALVSGAIQLTSGTATTLAAAGATTLAGTVGTAVASAVTVTATDQSGNPVAGAQVSFAVTAGGGSISGASQTTNASGQATAGSWTLGTVAGSLNTISATLGTLPSVVFSSTPAAGPASQLLMVTQPGTASAVNGAPLNPQPAVQVADQFGNPVSQVIAVTAAIASGGGALNGTATLSTGADGSLSFTDLTLVGLTGMRTLGFSAAGLSAATSAGFALAAGPATTMALSAGDGQSATVGSAVAILPVVLITDQSGNPVSGQAVTFAVTGGGGSVTGAGAVSDASGLAAVGSWMLGTVTGTNTLTATASLTGSPVTFTATGTPASATALSLETAPSSTATNGAPLAQQPAVQLRDQFGNPVSLAGTVITAVIGSGGGSVAGSTTAMTNAGGLATFSGLIVNGLVGNAQVLSFSGTGLTPVASGSITMVAGAASRLVITTQPSAAAVNGVTFAQQPVLQVSDAGGNPVTAGGVTVTAGIGSGAGTLGGTTSAVTSGAGVATFTNLVITGLVGSRTLDFSASGLTGVTSGSITISAGAATTIAAASVTSQSATAGSAVATPPSVLITDQSGNPVSGVNVIFAAATGGGSVTGGSVASSAAGLATVGSWTLGTAIGPNTLTASATGLSGSPVNFAATATAAPPANVAINAGDAQSATVGTAVATAPSVMVTDQFGNPVSGVSVTFAVTSGGGSVTGATPVTDAGGIAAVGSWTLGTLVGGNGLSATVSGLPVVNFTATGTVDAATALAISAGNGQSATVNSTVPVSPAVLITDQYGNPVPGVAVTFAVASGGGSATGTGAVSNASGIATVGSWTLGTAAGANTMTATATGLSGSPATFTASGTAGAATTMALNGGDGQSAVVGTAVSVDPSVLVTDQFGNPRSGVTVTFAVATGGGSVTGATALSSALGVATVGSWTLGTTTGANSLTATASGLTGSPVTFTATGTAAAASQVVITTQPSASAPNGVVLTQQPGVQLQDAFGNDVAQAGVTVTASVLSGSGTATGTTTAVTGASGAASFAGLSITGLVGNYTLSLSAAGLTGATTGAIALSAGVATSLILNAGDNQTATVNTAVTTAPSVLARDGSGNPVSGVSVTFAVASGGGGATGTSAVSNAGGIAAVGSWTLGTTAGPNTLTATSGSLSGSPVSFTATGTPAAASSVASNGGNGQTGTAGAALSTALSVLVTDNFGNPVSGFTVTWATPNGGTFTPTSSQSNASGIASASWTLGTAAGAQTASATATGLTGSPVAFGATALAGVPAAVNKTAGDNQSATVNSAVAADPAVQVTDQFGNPVAGVTVTFAAETGGGSVTGASQATDGAGLATVGSWTLGTIAGSNTMSATVSGVPAVTFSATGQADAATTIAASAGNGQSATVNTAVAVNPEVVVTDQFGNPVSGVVVNFNVTLGGGGIAGASGATDALGHATGGSWTLGQAAGTNTLEASSGLLSGSPVTFTATGAAAAATKLTITTQPSGTANSGATLAQQPVVQLSDAFGNPVSQAGVSVSASASTGGTLSGTTAVSTNAGGQASFTGLALSGLVGNYTLSFSATGLTGATSGTIALSPGTAASITMNAGNNQTATVNSNVPVAPSVLVRDASSNPVSGVSVTFAAATGGGSVGGSPAITDASGIATVGSWTLGTTAGANTLTATSAGLSGSPVTFSATGVAGAAATVSAQSATSQSGRVGIAATTLPSVLVRDAFGNPVPGESVTFAVTAGGGSVTGGSQTTDGMGIATVAGWTLGRTVVTNTVTATVGALPTVGFDATVTFEVASVKGGTVHACALTVDGIAYCWGDNGVGAVGDSSGMDRLSPAPVATSVAFSQAGMGSAHSCAVSTGALAYCWGDNSQRQLGDGSNVGSRLAPVAVASGTYTSIHGGFDHTCAIQVAGTLRCWGANSQGQLGRGTTGGGPFNTPQTVSLGFSYTQASGGTFFTCAVRSTGAAYCWGDNAFGQLGDSSTSDRDIPTAVKGGLVFSQVAASQIHTCGLTTGGLVYCWGGNISGRLGQDPGSVTGTTGPIQVPGLTGIVQLARGEAHTCARDGANQVFCWGLNQSGQLGDGNSGAGVFSYTPVAVQLPGGAGFTTISAGSQFSCGVTALNELYCWGEGTTGQLGDGTGLDRPLPTKVINP